MVELEPGDFLYQANQELFLVCIDDDNDSVEFAVHGWRTIDKDRLNYYLSADDPIMHTEEQVREAVGDKEGVTEKLDWLTDIFSEYEGRELPDSSNHDEFALDDT